MRAWTLATRTPWAMTEDALQTLLAIAARENADPKALAAEFGHELEATRTVTVRDGVAVIPVSGPLFRYANWLTRYFGASSYEDLATDFHAALDDPAVHSILLEVDSPGGEVKGCQELADMVHAARGVKPIVAYVDGWSASGAYWIASAADEMVTAETGMSGSIGVIAVYVDTSEADRKAGLKEIEIVSSISPKKAPNPAEEAGRAQIQALIDDLGEIFVGSVARNRGVERAAVLKNFGQGGVLVGERAVAAGLVDRVGSFEGTLAELVERATAPDWGAPAGSGLITPHLQERDMGSTATAAAEPQPAALTEEALRASHPELVQQIAAASATAERARILGIEEYAVTGHEALTAECKADPACSPEMAAARVLKAQKEADRAAAVQNERGRRRALAGIEQDEKELDAPAPNDDGENEGADGDEKASSRVIGIYNRVRGKRGAHV